MSVINALEEGSTEKSSNPLELEDTPAVAHDAVFGEITEEGPNYRNVQIPF